MRYVAAGAVAEVSITIHQHLKIRGELSLFGGSNTLMIPFLLHRYAYKIQSRSIGVRRGLRLTGFSPVSLSDLYLGL